MRILYLDCFSGISGDMTIGSLIDAGGDPAYLEKELKKLKIKDEYELQWKKVIKNGITATKFDVLLKNEKKESEAHSHVHTHNHEHSHSHSHAHHHEHAHHSHTHTHTHAHSHTHEHRSYLDIKQLIEAADYEKPVKDTALRIFKKIAEAEGHIHGMSLEEVHFHEVGAVDSIIDIVGTAILIDQLKITNVKSSPIPLGSGKIVIDHGVYPVPAPATLEILKGIPIKESVVQAELTTPTGAAIAAVLAEEYSSFPSMQVNAIGYGAGTKTFSDHPNVLRVVIGE